MEELTIEQLLTIPDPGAASFNPSRGVRRSMRTVAPRTAYPGVVIEDPVLNLDGPIATVKDVASVKRHHISHENNLTTGLSNSTNVARHGTPADGPVTSPESPSKKVKITALSLSSPAQAKSTHQRNLLHYYNSAQDDEFILSDLDAPGSPETLTLVPTSALLTTPPLSDESETSTPKSRKRKAVTAPMRASGKRATAAHSNAHAMALVNADATPLAARRPLPCGKPAVWAEVCRPT